jgi:hypothetical protein
VALFFHGVTGAFAVLGVGLVAMAALFVPGRDHQRALLLLAAPFLFALLDGFTMAGDVAVLALPPGQLAPMVVGFDAATLLAEIALPLCLLAGWQFVPKLRRMTAPGGFLPDFAASAFIALGMFWFASGLA